MPEQKGSEQQKSLEMRVAELEDKLSKIHITEEEMKAYQKVASLLGAQSTGGTAFACIVNRCFPCHPCVPACRPTCICICPCGPGFCNPCWPCACVPTGGTGSGGGGFGSLGT
jgi:hypothetical protein